jgi:hypothetical protein
MLGGGIAYVSTLLEVAALCRRLLRSAVSMCAWNLLSTGCWREATRLLGAVVDLSEECSSGRQPFEFAARGGCNRPKCEGDPV